MIHINGKVELAYFRCPAGGDKEPPGSLLPLSVCLSFSHDSSKQCLMIAVTCGCVPTSLYSQHVFSTSSSSELHKRRALKQEPPQARESLCEPVLPLSVIHPCSQIIPGQASATGLIPGNLKSFSSYSFLVLAL